ncbi:uncharacterized protein K460DRAFT_351845 [Cucurbitaria berberidis CBS 394.84]|uniref:Zn(2)-C6 fungal-type domain-containing protein n=1 Tax=Cucurbitaria berberidis CBS 394.84 TaxID=1168544 RepID=A0A9P4GSK7_9PLEO|nr:uncharacterized protein K460DRAFT_351845 [Cucurbitaria berberidis CBS 394.84]KAF1851988.1 hypothetical protein K460DRAFT_351845 [Cucurbitaria berberidis CBS 394.84]
MAEARDDTMPNDAAYEFDFTLPYGTDIVDGGNNDEHYHDSTENDHQQQMSDTTETSNNLDLHDQNNSTQAMNYSTFEKGFSDDEDAGEAFDRTGTGHQSGESLPKSKKSPRRSGGFFDDEPSPSTKRPRQSLFGGPIDENEERTFEEYIMDQGDDANDPKPPGQGIRYRMSSLSLEQKDKERCPSERPFNLGFGLGSSDRGGTTPRASPAPSEESIIIPPDDKPVYGLRTNIERKKTFTYVDTDKSGNFDPSEEAKQKILKMNKAKAAKAAAQQKKQKGKTREVKEHVMKLIVKLHFKAFGNVRNCTNDEENWPDGWSEADSDYEREAQEYRNFYRRNTPSRQTQIPVEDPQGDVDDLTGYPAARGCRHCRKHKQDCSMTGGGTYPCDECLEDDCECEPIIPTTIKGHCKQCVEDGQEFCSFGDDPDQAVCDHCAESEFICEALPPDGYKTDRINIYEIIGGRDRQYVQCTVCRQEKKRCSLKKKTDMPPCKYCKKHNIGCTFFDLPKQPDGMKTMARKGKGKVLGPTEGDAPEVAIPGSDYFTAEDLADMEMRDNDVISREVTPEMEMEDAEGHKGVLVKIQTSFAHPIQFSSESATAAECNFCEMPLFGMVGHFEKTVHVIKWDNGLGYSELGAGHREENGPTNLCWECTMGRAQITLCEGHQLEKMYEAQEALDFDVAAEDLMVTPTHTPEMRFQLQRWCSMCFSTASYRCCNAQPSLLFTLGAEEELMDGCGLNLCEGCAVRFTEEFGSNCDAMATAMENEPKQTEDDDVPAAARADVGFLIKDGLLMRNIENAMAAGQ